MKNTLWTILTEAFLLVAVLQLVGCSTLPKSTDPNAPPPLRKYTPKEGDENIIVVDDSVEGFNRAMYKFDYGFDKYVFLPIVRAYKFILPDYVEDRVSDFINNLGEFGNLYNNVLQAKWKPSGVTVARFSVNSTVGILGLWDPATHWGMREQTEDLGQTLGHWGVGNGSYLVLPVLGPSNIRDGVGSLGDGIVISTVGPVAWWDNLIYYWSLTAVTPVERRERVDFRYYSTGSPFEYDLVRMLYTEKREIDIKH